MGLKIKYTKQASENQARVSCETPEGVWAQTGVSSTSTQPPACDGVPSFPAARGTVESRAYQEAAVRRLSDQKGGRPPREGLRSLM